MLRLEIDWLCFDEQSRSSRMGQRSGVRLKLLSFSVENSKNMQLSRGYTRYRVWLDFSELTLPDPFIT